MSRWQKLILVILVVAIAVTVLLLIYAPTKAPGNLDATDNVSATLAPTTVEPTTEVVVEDVVLVEEDPYLGNTVEDPF